MRLELTTDEASLLAEVLDSVLSELSDDIAHTDTRDYRDGLKQRRATLREIRTRLSPGAA